VISFVGAGPGAADLITLRGAARLAAADVVVWASSLVPEALLDHCRPGVELHDSATMTLEDVLAVYAAHGEEAPVVRLHSGDVAHFANLKEKLFGNCGGCLAHANQKDINSRLSPSPGRLFNGNANLKPDVTCAEI